MKGTSGNWIFGAAKRPGAFTKKADARGLSVAAFAARAKADPSRCDATTRRRAFLLVAFLAACTSAALSVRAAPSAAPDALRHMLAAHEVDLDGAPPPGPWRWRGRFGRLSEHSVGDEVAARFVFAPEGLRVVRSASNTWVPSAFDFWVDE